MVKNHCKNEVRFESQFESGNLDAVFKVILIKHRLDKTNLIVL